MIKMNTYLFTLIWLRTEAGIDFTVEWESEVEADRPYIDEFIDIDGVTFYTYLLL